MAPARTNRERVQYFLDGIRALDNEGMRDYMASFQPHLTLVAADDVDAAGAGTTSAAARHRQPPRVVFRYTVQPEHCNRMDNLHGGAVATLFDFCTSMAMILGTPAAARVDADADADAGADADTDADGGAAADHEVWRRLGVSRTLDVTYLRPTPCGTEVLLECDLVHGGRRLSQTRGVMRRASDGAVLATCEHGKVVPDAPSKL